MLRNIVVLFILSTVVGCNLNGEKRTFNRTASGKILSVGDSLNGKRVGEWIFSTKYSANDYDTSEIKNYRRGKLHGLSKSRSTDANGNYVWEHIYWKNGKKDGPSYQIDHNGNKLFMGLWKNDKEIGIHTHYYFGETVLIEYREAKSRLDWNFQDVELGNRIAWQYEYNKQGILHGKSVTFNKKGKLEGYGYYKSGVEHGIWLENNGYVQSPDETRLSIGYYREGKKNGVWLTYKPKFYNSISEYEDNPSFFLKLRDLIRKEDYESRILYSDDKVISSKYYYDGKVFNSENEKTDYFIKKTFGTVKNSPPKESAFSF
jgi:antitoxin component YwqK of YwqJK toxin-antitoxin module